MMAAPNQWLRLEVEAHGPDRPLLTDAWRLVRDLDRLYDIARLGTDPAYDGYRFSRQQKDDEASPLLPIHRSAVERLHLGSPFELVTSWATVGGGIAASLWVIVQTFERVYNMKLNREKLQLEVERLRRDEPTPRRRPPAPEEMSEHTLHSRGGTAVLEMVGQRLAASPFRIIRAEIEVIDVDGVPRWKADQQ